MTNGADPRYDTTTRPPTVAGEAVGRIDPPAAPMQAERPEGHQTPPQVYAGRPLMCGCGKGWLMVCKRGEQIRVQIREKHGQEFHYLDLPLEDYIAEIRRVAARIQ